jgi:hypothetical protein
MQALATIATFEEQNVRWEAEIHFKMSIALELADRADEAHQHVRTAITLISRLLKEVRAFSARAIVAPPKSNPPCLLVRLQSGSPSHSYLATAEASASKGGTESRSCKEQV